MRKQDLQESKPAKTIRQSATKNSIRLHNLFPTLLLAATLTLFVTFTTLPHGNLTETGVNTTAEDNDSILPIIAWFSKHDTMTYWISEGNWKFNGTDTVKTLGVYTKVMITVTDSTKKGYKMEYKFLTFSMDTDTESEEQDFMQTTIHQLQKEVAGTTIKFRTDETGKIIKYDNLKEVEKQAKHVFDKIIQESSFIDNLASVNINADELFKSIDARELVKSYTEELEILFQFHGYQFPLKETIKHNEATDTQYKSDTYMSTTIDPENYEYNLIVNTKNYIPKQDVKQLLGVVIDTFTDNKEATALKEKMNAGVNEQITEDAVYNDYLHMKYFPDGWPKKVISQKSTFIGNKGKLIQKYITWDYRSVGNSN